MTFPDPPASRKVYADLDDLVGQVVEITAIEDRSGIPVAVAADGTRYLCDGSWASQGATYIEGYLSTNNVRSIKVAVVQEHGQTGFRPAEQLSP